MGTPDQPLVSAVLPVYNGERFLRAAIESVLNQSYPAIEVVVVDDGSTDGSAAILGDYSGRIVSIRQSNVGVAQARNAGVRASHGEFVAFLDQDDWWRPAKIEKQMALCLADLNIDLVHTGVAHYDDTTETFVGRLNPRDAPHELVGQCYERLLLGNAIYNATVMVRRSAIDRVGGFDTSIAGNTVADYDLWLRLARQSIFAFVPEELAVFRLHPEQGTWKRREMLTAELRVLADHLPLSVRRQSPALRGRIAGLLESLGIAHLDAHEAGLARHYFGHALREQPSGRRLGLWIASLLPTGAAEWLRVGRSVVRLRKRSAGKEGV
jgi:glycosyltransferase involved in cell wall biosynthesis